MFSQQSDLEEAAFKLGAEIHDGEWNHIPEIHVKPAADCAAIVEELRRRCPGFTLAQYQRAIATGLFASR